MFICDKVNKHRFFCWKWKNCFYILGKGVYTIDSMLGKKTYDDGNIEQEGDMRWEKIVLYMEKIQKYPIW